MNFLPCCAVVLFFFACPLAADMSVTVYNQNIGLVRDVRDITLKNGAQKISFSDVAANILPASVSFKLADAPESFSVLEQNFEYDLISRDKLLQKYIGKEIEIQRPRQAKEPKEVITGTLLSAAGNLTVQTGDRIVLDPQGEISLAKLPEGLVLKPTLSCLAESKVSGTHSLEIGYLTGGITWNADYVVVSGEKGKTIDLTGWVTIDNRSGGAYPDAQLKLVAGDVNIVEGGGLREKDGMVAMAAKAQTSQFGEKPFFEYHLYTLQRRTSIADNQTKQIEFISAANIPAKKIFRYNGGIQEYNGYFPQYRTDRAFGMASNEKVSVMLQFTNSKSHNLGVALPKGTLRIYQRDDDGSLELIGENRIDHTPENEDVSVELGNAFDIVGERIQTDFKSAPEWCEDYYTIKLRNHKKTAAEVQVIEKLLRWQNWKIKAHSADFVKDDSQTIHFTVTVPPDGEKAITYTARYEW